MTDEMAISYQAQCANPVLSSTGTQIGTLEHVLEVPEVDVFDGIVIATRAGLRFIDADYVQRITRSHIWCSLDDAQAAQLPHLKGRRCTASMRSRTRAIACTTSWDACFAARTGLARMTKANQSPIKATITVSGPG